MSIKVGDKVRVRPSRGIQYGFAGHRGFEVVEVDVKCIVSPSVSMFHGHGPRVRLLKQGREVVFATEDVAPDVDMPYDPIRPEKTLPAKEREVYEADSARQRRDEIWRQEFRPEPVEEEKPLPQGPFYPPGRYTVKYTDAERFLFQSGVLPPGTSLKKWAKTFEEAEQLLEKFNDAKEDVKEAHSVRNHRRS